MDAEKAIRFTAAKKIKEYQKVATIFAFMIAVYPCTLFITPKIFLWEIFLVLFFFLFASILGVWVVTYRLQHGLYGTHAGEAKEILENMVRKE